MGTSNQQADWALGLSVDPVVDWQTVRTADAAACHTGDYNMRQMRERLKALEARALTLSRAVVRDPAAVVAQRSLVALDAEIVTLRAELAWHRAAARERHLRAWRHPL